MVSDNTILVNDKSADRFFGFTTNLNGDRIMLQEPEDNTNIDDLINQEIENLNNKNNEIIQEYKEVNKDSKLSDSEILNVYDDIFDDGMIII